MIGAIASKKAKDSSPVSSRIASLNASEVRGPVATITESQSAGGRPATSPPFQGDHRFVLDCCSDRVAEPVAVDGQGAAGRQTRSVAAGQYQRPAPAHFPHAAGQRRYAPHRRIGTSWSKRAPPTRRSGGHRCRGPGASRAGRPGRPFVQAARPLRKPARPPPMTCTGRSVMRSNPPPPGAPVQSDSGVGQSLNGKGISSVLKVMNCPVW